MLDSLRELLSQDEQDPDEWVLIRTSPDRGEVDRFDEPISSTRAMLDLDLPDGRYRLQAVRGGRFEETEWDEVVGEPGGDDRGDEIEELRDEISRLRERERESEPEQPVTPEAAIEREKARLALGALNSEEFIEKHGEKIALSMFQGTGTGPSVDFDKAMDHPIGAAIWEFKENPNKLSDMTAALLDGVTQVDLDQGAGSGGGAVEEPEGDESDEDEGRGSPLGVDAGPTTLDDLGEMGEEALAEADDPDGPITPEPGEGDGGRDPDPDLCQHLLGNGDQCGNAPVDGSDYCHIEGHGPGGGEPTAEEVADDL